MYVKSMWNLILENLIFPKKNVEILFDVQVAS